MENLKRTSDIVKYILTVDPATRSSDNLLYYRVCEHLNKDVLQLPFGFTLLTMKSQHIPPFESVRRSRQKVQATHPELAGTDIVEAKRKEQEAIYHKFAKETV